MDTEKVKKALRQAIESVPGPLDDPAPFIGISDYLDSSIQYTMRVWVKNVDYWDVYFALTEKDGILTFTRSTEEQILVLRVNGTDGVNQGLPPYGMEIK